MMLELESLVELEPVHELLDYQSMVPEVVVLNTGKKVVLILYSYLESLFELEPLLDWLENVQSLVS
jgi:hypothetical protein